MNQMKDTLKEIKDTLGKHWENSIVVTGIMHSGKAKYDVAENDLLPGELTAETFTVGCYTVRSAQRVYKITDGSHYLSELPADEAEVSLVKEQANSLFQPWRDKLRIVHEISAKHDANSNGVFTHICSATRARNYSWTERIGAICSVKEKPAVSDEMASLLVGNMYMGDSFSVEHWYKLGPDGAITKLTLHPFDEDLDAARFS